MSPETTADETVSGRLALDRDGKRALLVGGWWLEDSPNLVCALSLEGEARWQKLATAPVDPGTYQIVDPKRRQLVVFGAPSCNGEVSAFGLDDSKWSSLRAPGGAFPALATTRFWTRKTIVSRWRGATGRSSFSRSRPTN